MGFRCAPSKPWIRFALLQRHPNPLSYRVGVFENLVIPKSQHTEACALQALGSREIECDILRVLAPIHLDDQAAFQANEV
jgi:hypothetical protein